jgi:AcrR family transcriptional regulator
VRHVDNETTIALLFHLVPVSTGIRRNAPDDVGPVPAVPPIDLPAPARVHHLGADDRSSQRIRIVDATLACIANRGVAKTTLDDIATWAGLSRATVYRAFPGGRDAIFAATVDTEVARLCSDLAVAMGEAKDLEEVLVAAIVETARRIADHKAISYLLEHEPGVLLRHLCFDQMDRVLEVASTFAAPFLARWLEPDQAARAAEWATRITFTYLSRDAQAIIDPTDRKDVGRLVSRFVLPGVLALRASGAVEATAPPKPRAPRSKPKRQQHSTIHTSKDGEMS